jgi:hypothetical protein
MRIHSTKVVVVLLCSLALQGCAVGRSVWTELARDPRDAPWDAPPDRLLFEQLPPWQGGAHAVCCSALRKDEYLRMRCDTPRPVAPRTNRC